MFERVPVRFRNRYSPFILFGEGSSGSVSLYGAWAWVLAYAQEVESDEEEAACVGAQEWDKEADSSQVPIEEVEEWSINEQSSSIGYACARSRLEWHMHRLSTSTVTVTVRNRNGHVMP